MSNEPCKYCKKTDHKIDFCPDVICRKCKEYGHAHWKCKKSKDGQSKGWQKGGPVNTDQEKKKVVKRTKAQQDPILKTVLSDNVEAEIKDIGQLSPYLHTSWGELL